MEGYVLRWRSSLSMWSVFQKLSTSASRRDSVLLFDLYKLNTSYINGFKVNTEHFPQKHTVIPGVEFEFSCLCHVVLVSSSCFRQVLSMLSSWSHVLFMLSSLSLHGLVLVMLVSCSIHALMRSCHVFIMFSCSPHILITFPLYNYDHILSCPHHVLFMFLDLRFPQTSQIHAIIQIGSDK